jgi:hypothetical protein
MATPPHKTPATAPTDLVWLYEQFLDSAYGVERVQIPKWRVPTLPARFERTWLGTVPEGAIDSYRDMGARTESAHINEFPAYWELHVDSFNPHYYPVSHVLADTDVVPVLGEWAVAVAETPLATASPVVQTLSTGTLVGLRLGTAVTNRASDRVGTELNRLLESL